MAVDQLPAWQEEALQKMREHLEEWLPDHKLHLVLIRAPFHIPGTNIELTDPAFEKLLAVDKAAAHAQLEAEFRADRLAAMQRDRRREQAQKDGASHVRSLVGEKRRSRARGKAQAHSAKQTTLLP